MSYLQFGEYLASCIAWDIVLIALARAFVLLTASLRRQGRLKADARPIAAGLVFVLALGLVVAPVAWIGSGLPNDETMQLRWIVVAVYCLVGFAAARLLRRPRPG